MQKIKTIRLKENEFLMLNEIITEEKNNYQDNLIDDEYSFFIRYCIENYYQKIIINNQNNTNFLIDILDEKTKILFEKLEDEIKNLDNKVNEISENIEYLLDISKGEYL